MVEIKVTGFVGRDTEKYGKLSTISVNAGARINGTKNAEGNFEYINDWYNFICFDKSLDGIIKGDKVTVEGTLEYSKYKAKDGTEKTATRYIVTNITKVNPTSK